MAKDFYKVCVAINSADVQRVSTKVVEIVSVMKRTEIGIHPVQCAIVSAIQESESPLRHKDLFQKTNEFLKAKRGKGVSSRYFIKMLNSLTDEGILDFEEKGTEKYYALTEETIVDTESGVAKVLAPITTDLTTRLKDTLTMFRIRGKLHNNIATMFSENPNYQNPQGLNWLLNSFKIKPNTARIISDHVFSSYQAQFQPAMGPMPRGASIQYGMSRRPNYQQYPQQYQPQVRNLPGGPQIITMPMPGQQGGMPPLILVNPNQPSTQPGAVEHRTVEKMATRRRVKYRLDKDGKQVLNEKTGQPIVEEIIEEPVVVGGGGGRQLNAETMLKMIEESRKSGFEQARALIELAKPKGESAPPVDEEKIVMKTREELRKDMRSEIDPLKSSISGTNRSIEDLSKTIGNYFLVEKATKPFKDELRKIQEGRGLTDSQFRLQTQERLIKHVGEKLGEPLEIAKEFMSSQKVQTLAVLEQSMGLEPGTFVIPYLTSSGMKLPKGIRTRNIPQTSPEERKSIIEKAREKVQAG